MPFLRKIAAPFWKNGRAQDVAEYCLITALIALIALGIFWHVSGGLQGMWNSMNASITNNAPSSGSGTGGGN